MNINKVILLGRVGKDPEVRYLENKTPVASFPLATSERYKNKSGEIIENTTWHNIVVWRAQAEIVEKYVVKGSELYIEGKITSRTYNDKEGNKRYITEIVANQIQLGRRPQENQGTENQSVQDNANQPKNETVTQNTESQDDFDVVDEPETDDLPF